MRLNGILREICGDAAIKSRPALTGSPNDVERILLEEGLARVNHQHTLVVGTFHVQKSLNQGPANGRGVVTTEDGRLQPLSVDLEGCYVKPIKATAARGGMLEPAC